MMNYISENEFDALFKEHLKDRPNQGNGFFGSWAWNAKQKREFLKSLKEKGIEVKQS